MSAEQAFGHRQNYLTTRAECLGVFAVAAAFLWHIDEVRWGPAVRLQRAVGSRSPSLAVATTMHHFSVHPFWGTAAPAGALAERVLRQEKADAAERARILG